MGTINFSGLSGLDTEAIVEALLSIERRPLEQIEQQQALTQLKREFFQEISSQLGSLESAIGSLNKLSGLNAKSASSSNENVLTASATAFAQNGTFTISEITRLATNHSESFLGVADKTAQFVSGTTFDFSVNGNDYSIDVSALAAEDQTLEGLRDAINDQAGDDVTAVIINTGDPDDPYKLSLRSNESGEEAQITGISTDIQVTTSTGSAALATVAGEQVLGENALFTFNGVEISRASNTVDDLLEGISFTLKAESASPVSITVDNDTAEIESNIQSFIDAYNEINAVIQEQFTFNPETGSAGALSGDSTLRSIQSTLQSLVVGGVADADGNRYSLGTIGIDVDSKTGELSLDSERLQEALESGDKELLLDLFMVRGTASNSDVSYVTSTDATQAGTYSINITGDDGNGNVTGTFTLNGEVFVGVGNGDILIGPEGTAAEGLKVRIANGATGDLGTLFLSVGVAEKFERQIDGYVAPITGLLPSLDDALEEQINSFNDQIEIFEERLAQRERILLAQFAAAEEALAALQSQQSAFESQLKGLQGNSK
jgi:flagellar hook-associated protein 2